METNIWINKSLRKINPDEPILTTKAATSFCACNRLRQALVRSQGDWYIISRYGILEFVARTLYLISFRELYHLLKDN